jgi:hypothetical protein
LTIAAAMKRKVRKMGIWHAAHSVVAGADQISSALHAARPANSLEAPSLARK